MHTSLRISASLILLCLPSTAARAQESQSKATAPEASNYPELTIHAEPKRLAAEAQVEDWPAFLGEQRDGRSHETRVDLLFGTEGPRLLWEMQRGTGYASPVVAGDRLIFTHRIANTVYIDCLEASTGKRHWRQEYSCEYAGPYIKNSGPRATPAIAGQRVYVHGVDGELLALDLESGEVIWQRNTCEDFGVDQGFFGVVSSPLVLDGQLVQNIGAPKGPCVVGFDLETGKTAWGLGERWGPSCASPVSAKIHGKRKLFVLTGGQSRPPTGGLLAIDWDSKKIDFEFPYRSRTYESVNASTPVIDGNRVFLTVAYGAGSAALQLDAEGGFDQLWKNRHQGQQFSTQVMHAGVLYGVDGAPGQVGELIAIDPATGQELWQQEIVFDETVGEEGQQRVLQLSVGEGSLLSVADKLLVLGDTGQLVTLLPGEEGAEVLAHATLFNASEAWTPLVLSRGLLYVCQNNPARLGDAPARLLCYDLRGE